MFSIGAASCTHREHSGIKTVARQAISILIGQYGYKCVSKCVRFIERNHLVSLIVIKSGSSETRKGIENNAILGLVTNFPSCCYRFAVMANTVKLAFHFC